MKEKKLIHCSKKNQKNTWIQSKKVSVQNAFFFWKIRELQASVFLDHNHGQFGRFELVRFAS